MGVARIGLLLVAAVLVAPGLAYAQCSTDDLDMDGVPDVCPAGSNYIEGTAVAETLRGSNDDDCIFGFGGDDTIQGRNGDDYICAGDGADDVVGGGDNDAIFGEGGADTLNGSNGNDFIDGGDGDDILDGSSGDDTVNGGAGNDEINGGAGADSLSGQDGDDALSGSGGNDSLSGGNGIDTLDGGGGTDTCVEEVPGTADRLTNCDTITYAALSGFDVLRTAEGLTATWQTTTEVGVVAFRLWRRESNGALAWVGEVPAALDGSPQGATYFLADQTAAADDSVDYLVEERTVSGGSVLHGPFVRTPKLESARDRLLQSQSTRGRVPHRVMRRRLERPAAGSSMQSFARKSLGTPVAAVLAVEAPGLIEVDAAAIAEALGSSPEEVANLIRSGGLHLRLRGESIAWHGVDDGAALRFVSPEVRSPFSRQHRYLLSVEDGVTMESHTLTQVPTTDTHAFLETRRFEENVFAGPTGGPDPRQDLFFWHALGSNEEAVIALPLPSLYGSAASELRVLIHGATEHPLQPHRVELRWNGQSLGTFDLLGRQRHTITVPLDGIAAALENELVVHQHVAGEAPPAVYVDAVEVDYVRFAEADSPVFRFAGSGEGVHSVAELMSETVYLYDVSEPMRPTHYGAVQADEAGGVSFTAEGSDLRFLVSAPESISPPLEVTPRFATDLRASHQDADYLIIAASHLVEDAQALAELRTADGYRVLLVDIDDVYWEFADGEPDPLAVRSFLSFAGQQWETAPRFATLVGAGSLDYRDLMELGGNWVPAPLAPTDGGLFPSDSMLGDIVGDDGVPEVAIGRLPITTAQELHSILDAIEAFEANHESLDALFAADDSERDEFAAAARLLTGWTTPERTQEIDLNSVALEDAREHFFSSWQGALGWVSYVGHGGLDRLATEGLVTSEDVPALAEMQSTPLVLGWTCNMVRFDIPGFVSLGEQLVTSGSSAGVFSATGWSNHVDTDALRTAFTEAAFASDAETIGEVMLRAHQAAVGAPVPLHRVYMLLGDPALRLRAAKAQPDLEPDPNSDPDPAREPIEAPEAGDRSPAASWGCEIAAPGAGRGPLGLGALVACLALMIRRRRA